MVLSTGRNYGRGPILFMYDYMIVCARTLMRARAECGLGMTLRAKVFTRSTRARDHFRYRDKLPGCRDCQLVE
jgi:hypothetical protein